MRAVSEPYQLLERLPMHVISSLDDPDLGPLGSCEPAAFGAASAAVKKRDRARRRDALIALTLLLALRDREKH